MRQNRHITKDVFCALQTLSDTDSMVSTKTGFASDTDVIL